MFPSVLINKELVEKKCIINASLIQWNRDVWAGSTFKRRRGGRLTHPFTESTRSRLMQMLFRGGCGRWGNLLVKVKVRISISGDLHTLELNMTLGGEVGVR